MCVGKISPKLDFLPGELEKVYQLSKSLVAVTNTFISMRENKNPLPTLERKENYPPNKRIDVQQRFRSVTKRKPKTRVRPVIPTVLEQESILNEMLVMETQTTEPKVLNLLGLDGGEGKELHGEIIGIDFVVDTLKKQLPDGKQILDILTKVKDLHESWQCQACKTIKYANMIECDQCASWFHWDCDSGGEAHPSSTTVWFCPTCLKQPSE